MPNTTFECEKIQAILDELNTLEPLPAIGSPEAMAEHADWMARRRVIEEHERDAEGYALLSIPPEVDALLRQVKARRRVLFNMKPRPEDAEAPISTRALLTAFADAVRSADQEAMRRAQAKLDRRGIVQSGYAGAPLFWQDGVTLLGQVTFNYTKAGPLRKRDPYTITLKEETPND